MATVDKSSLLAKQEAARQKIERARRNAESNKKLQANPPPRMVNMPAGTGDPEVDSIADLNEIEAGFRNRAKQESNRFDLVIDTEYWYCTCFQSRKQKEQFLAALKILEFGDKFLDGLLVAERLGIKLDPVEIPFNPTPRIDPKLASFVK